MLFRKFFTSQTFWQKVIFAAGLYFITILPGFTQQKTIQWADYLVHTSNSFQGNDWSGEQALGKPDAFPPGYLSKGAFRLKEYRSFGTILVGFSEAQPIQQLIVVENFNPGRIEQIKLIDEQGYNYIIYQNVPYKAQDQFRTLVLTMPRTDYKVKTIEVQVNSEVVAGYCQIDAIGIIDNGDINVVKNTLQGPNFNVYQELTYTASKELLGKEINSRYTEAKPVVSYDGRTLYFSRMFHPQNTWGKEDPQDIYFSELVNKAWSKAQNIGVPLNDQFANGICTISPDGKSMLVINAYERDGSISPGVSLSRKTAAGWGSPQRLFIDNYSNNSQFLDFFISPDESVLFMAVERPGGFGNQDLYISKRVGFNRYSEPINLGKSINTVEAEFSPFLSEDGKLLYFASEGHNGFGKSDIFYSERLDDSWLKWSEPKNVGPAINTDEWEAYFSITSNGQHAYFVSSEGTRNGSENIYRIPLLQERILELPQYGLTVKGRIMDLETTEMLEAKLTIEEIKSNQLIETDYKSGNFETHFYEQKEVLLTVKAKGYATWSEIFEVNPYESRLIVKDVMLRPLKVGTTITLDKLYFQRSKAALLESSKPALTELTALLKENPGVKIELAGHTDGLGQKEANLRLSVQRVQAVKDYLVMNGVEKNRIEAVGYGGSQPVAPNDTEENRSKNRRVEVKITENEHYMAMGRNNSR